MKLSDVLETLGLRLPVFPRLQPAGIGEPLQFSASGGRGGGGGGDYDDPDDDLYADYDDVPDPEPAPRQTDEGRQPTAARRRTVQSEPDERYWTDYLRIALPVIGLLLVIAVFWFWAQQLIDNPEDDLTPTETPGLAEVIDTPTEQPVEQAVATPPQQAVQPTPTPPAPAESTQAPVVTPTPVVADETTDTGAEEGEEPAANAGAGGIQPDIDVSVIEGPLNMRAEASTDADIVVTLETDEVLSVLSGPEEGESYVWWQVTDQAGNIGWVAEDFIEPAE